MFSALFIFLSFILPSHASPVQQSTFNGTDGSTTLSDTPTAASLDEVSNNSPLFSCELDGRPPKVSDCILLVKSHVQDSDFRDTYIYGQGGNYSGPYTWRHDECEFELVVRTGDTFESTLQSIFGLALFGGTTCANRDSPRGSSAVLNDGRAVIYVRNSQGSLLPSTINSFSAHNGTANLSNPAIAIYKCVFRVPAPSFNDCIALFMDESIKFDSTEVRTFGPHGSYRGPYSWVHGACGFQLGMNQAPFLATTFLWIFQTALEVMMQCARLSPPEGGIALLDNPHRGIFIRAFRPLPPVSQQKRSLPPPSPLPSPPLSPPLSAPHALTLPAPNFNNSVRDSIHCVPTMSAPNLEDCFLLRTNYFDRPEFHDPVTFGHGGNYTGAYAWEYGHCRFLLAVIGSCTWEASISKVFERAAAVWWECGRSQPPHGGYSRTMECEGSMSVYVFAVGLASGVGGGGVAGVVGVAGGVGGITERAVAYLE